MKREDAIGQLCLEPLPVLDVPVAEAVDMAAAAGFSSMSLWVNSPTPQFVAPCRVERADAAALVRRMRDAGVRARNLEVFRVGPGTDVAQYEAAVALGAELGATTATAIAKDGSEGTAESLVQLTGLAAAHGIRVNVEFLSYRGPCTLPQAIELVGRTGDAGTGVLLDILHLVRSGGSVEQVRAMDPGLIGHVQLCDGPLAVPAAGLEHESASDRMLPGTGDFPLDALIDALPVLPLGLEIPRMSTAFTGLTPAERVSTLLAASVDFLRADCATRIS
ncbi:MULTISPECIES: sugar phosphate isomerase/epimerase family protein [unclassified Sphingobium]|uniref:sugar phosphate isomerase/epimerase family protein n=1 Tax=unclassified Sphingobium TaxID=2611147 RepID=UPI0035A5D6B9